MKKILAVLLCMMMLFGTLPAMAGGVSQVMVVANCEQWVSLRKAPDLNSQRLTKVHLGELVTNCSDAGNGFIKCTYGKTTGYIRTMYLNTTSFSSSDAILPNQMVINCNEWVSLWDSPSSSANRLAKVPLGSVVKECISYSSNYVYCVYNGKRGYISSKYLTGADWTMLDSEKKSYPAINNPMEIVNCNEWVSLRSLPSTSADRRAKVPLGAVVEHCERVNELFIKCTYQGKTGYIQVKYLKEVTPKKAEPAVTTAPPQNSGIPSIVELLSTGNMVLQTTVNGCLVISRLSTSAEKEELITACYDGAGNPLWSVVKSTDQVTELTSLDAFIAGTAERPLVVIFKAGEGFTAYEIGSRKDPVWICGDEFAKSVTGCLSRAVADDGTMYVCGYYNGAPLCISANGVTMWKAENTDTNIYWPFMITLTDRTVDVLYDSSDAEGFAWQVSYGLDGQNLSQSLVGLN